jgi:hypothetical protein
MAALNFYAEHPHAFTESLELGGVFATHVALARHETSSARPRRS